MTFSFSQIFILKTYHGKKIKTNTRKEREDKCIYLYNQLQHTG